MVDDGKSKEVIVPFLKWAGGKRWFCDNHLNLLPRFSGRYIEPFLGSAAVFFALQPANAILTDLNAELIIAYRAVRNSPTEVMSRLEEHHQRHNSDYYYRTRANKPANAIELAAWFIYLNRTCWNGLYRVNLRNQFNVPMGTKTEVVLASDKFEKVSKLLECADLSQSDFERSIDMAADGDFVFIDPPYTVKHNLNGFLKYNDRIFSWGDQVRLRDAIVRATNRGAMVMVLNANHESIRELYLTVGQQNVLSRASVLAASPANRSAVEELLVRTWLPPLPTESAKDSALKTNSPLQYQVFV